MDVDKRATMRTRINTSVMLSHPSFGEVTLKSRDISDGGLSVFLSHKDFPPVGTIVDVLIKPLTGVMNREPVKMKVMHIQTGIAGLKFI